MRLFLSALFVLFSQFAVAQTDVPGCTIEIACNYDPAATVNDGSCDFTSCLVLGCTDATACNFNPAATVNDGTCDYLSCLIPGCTLANACNFDPSAEVNDGSCEYTSCAGCTNEFADNYDATATVDDGSCDPIEGCTSPQACNFNVNANQDDGSCDFVSCLATGCTVLEACNYDADAQVNDGSCVFAEEGRDCAGNCLEDADGDNVCDGDEILGCTSATALNYNAVATDDDGTCIEPVGGCTDPEACNYDEIATNDDGSCEFTSCAGCLQESACNYDENAIYANESCEFPPFGFDCDGNCLNDSDGDGVCDPFEVVGCQDMSACNFDPSATDPGQCNFATPNFDCDGNSLRPIFTSFPSNVTVQGWQVPDVSEAVVEAIVSPFAPTFEATYNGNLCYDDAPSPMIVFDGEVKIEGVCEHDYTLFRSWTATDCSGFSRTREQIIIVVDTVAPELFVPENMTVLCEDVAAADFGDAFGTDDCGEVTINVVESVIEGDCPGNYTIVRTFNAMDPCLNTTSAQQTITVVDETAPTILALSDLVLDCSVALPTNLPEATDNCSQVEVTVSEAVIPGDCPQTYRMVRTFTATDECGNESTSIQNVDVVDDTAPVVLAGWDGCEDPASCAIDINGLEGESIPEANLDLADDCDDEPTFSSTDVVLSASDALEVVLREYTISDACGNTLILQEQFNVTLVNPGCTDVAACNYNAEANLDDDSCEFCSCGQNACGCLDAEACNYDSSADYDDGSCAYPEPGFDCDGVCFDVNANDICDFEESGCTDASACNYDDVAQVDDGSCDYCCGYEVFTSTEAGYGVSIDLVQTHTSGALAGLSTYRVYITTPNNNDILTAVTGGDEFPLALHTTTSFYQNVFGGCLGTNISSAMMVVAPDAAYDSYVTIGATSSDDLAGGEAQLIPGAWIESFEAGNSITVDDNIGSGWFLVPPGGENGVSGDDNKILVAQLTTDGLISGSFRVQIFPQGDQVNDVRPDLTFEQQPLQAFACPIIEQGPADAVVSCDDVPGIPSADAFEVSYANATAAALGCEGELAISLISDDITEGNCAGNYEIARTLEIENCAGGSAQYIYTLSVEDTTAPTFDSVPADYTIECSADMVMEDATASDNCGAVTLTSSTETIAGNATGNYTLVRTFTATDDCGNSSSATQTITVEDTTAPEFTNVPADYTIECSDDLVLDDATAVDNCNGADIQVSSEIVEGNATGNYTVIRTFTATDDAGNSRSATQTITVEDTTAPEFTNVPADYTAECSDELVLEEASAADNCDGVVMTYSEEVLQGTGTGNYTLIRTWTATDDAGNSNSISQIITVQDTTLPELSIPSDYTAECTDELVYDDANATDNCGTVELTMTSSTEMGSCAGTKTITRTWTATDDAGNSTSATQTISVVDTTAPELSIPSDYIAECDEELVFDDATASDNCSECLDNFSFTSTADGYGLSLELVASHETGELAGMRTYRVYLDVADAADQVTSFTGNDEFALALNTTTTFYQNGFGGATPNDITASAIALVPELAYDSYVTVGLMGQPQGAEGSVELIPGSWVDAFEAGQSITINDGVGSGWYIVPPTAVNGLGGADQRVLVAQLTTDGDLSGQFRTQVFPQGDQVNDVRADLTFAHSHTCTDVAIEVVTETTPGACASEYTIARTFTATDDCGNSSSATQTITVQDTTAPELSIPADYTAECTDELVFDDATASDNCSEVSITVASETTMGDCAGNYAIVRTFTATDDCGNSTSATQTITVQDTTGPVLSIPADYTAECDEELVLEEAFATDNCRACTDNFDYTSTVNGYGLSLELIADHDEGELAGMSTYRVYLDVAHATDQVTSFTGNDEFALALNTTTSFYQNALGGVTPNELNEGAIALVPELAYDSYVTVGLMGQPQGAEGSVELIPGTWADAFEAGQSFTINDGVGSGWYIVPPTALNGQGGDDQRVLVAQLTTDGDISGQFRTQVFPEGDQINDVRADLTFTHSRACESLIIEVTSEETAGDCSGSYTLSRTFTATDACGNSTSAIQTITVEDTTAPEFTSVPADYTVECSDEMPMDDAAASDNCSEVSITVSSDTTAGNAAGTYTIVRTFTATDDCGNSASASQTITVEDTTAPELSIPADYTAECSDELILADATATDNCGEVTIEVSSEETAGDCVGSYTLTRTFTATDDAGNSTSATQTITVEDTTAPEFTSVPADYTVECSDEMPMDDAAASDNCSEVSITVSSDTTAGNAAGNYTIVRTFTATDDCGNSASASQTITVEDTTAPELSIPADYTAECSDELILEDATATDNCGEVTIEVSSEETAGDCAGSYTLTRTFTATDDAGNISSATQTITIEDTTAPELTIPADYTAECDATLVMDDATASDNCSEVSITVSSDTTAGDAAGTYTIVRTFTATDDCGNSASASQTITVEDTTAPELSIPADYTAECSDELILEDATATDNCGEVTIEVSSEETAGDCAGSYTLTRTFTATDDAGNISSATQTITVEDTTAPEFTSVPADYTVECSDEMPMDDAAASDNCSEVSITVSSDTTAGNAAGNYTIVRTFTATDDCGNSASASQTITVEDTTAPELSIPADYTAECSDELILADATATDNCGEVTIEVSSEETAGDCAGSYTLTRTFTATDDAGNISSATQTITVEDTTAPEFTSVPADYTVECSDEMPMDDATASDNCSEVSITVSSDTTAGNAAGNYTIVRTFTATDDCGNSTTASQTITVEDTTAPQLTIPADYTAECSDELILEDATATDNCGEVTIEVSSEETAGDCAGSYTLTRTFTATDDAGNSTSASQTITIEDTTAPEFTSVPADYTVECSDEMPMDDATASDNCSEVSITVSSDTTAGNAAGNYTIVRTFTATDDCGNSTTASQTITVEDTTAPELTIPADYTAECSDELILEDATATDNCGEVTIEVSSEETAGDCAGSYTLTRTFTATDDAGNSSSATQTITVEDTTAPEFTSVPADYTVECSDEMPMDDAAASDNCSEVSITVSSDTTAGNAAGNYTIVRTFTATDDCGNSTTASQTITVEDTTAPELTIPADYTAECSDELILDDATATDNCGEVTIEVSSEETAGDCAGSYTLTRTFTATDDAGNSSSATQTITVEDTTAPELTIPADYTAECTDELTLDDATASDNCSEVTITLSEETLAGDCANGYVLVRTFTATDDCGNNSSATQTITVVDTTGPELFLPPSYEADCGDELVLLDALASDACGLALVTVEETYDYTCDNSYVLTRTFTAVDACFNETVGVQTITVTDTTAPEFTSVPADFSAECSDDIALDMATATDNCGDVTVTVETDTLDGGCANTYTLVRTFTATDACGNSTEATQTIEIADTTAPEFTFVPEDQLIECNTSLSVTMATAVDNCGDVSVTMDEVLDQSDCGGAYVITRTFTATDACGNSTTAVQTITQEDTTAPTLEIAEDVTVECDEALPAPSHTADDACGAVTVDVTEEIVEGDCPQEMTVIRTYTATDDCGNSTSAVQTINVVDTTAPEFTFTPDATSVVYEADGDTLDEPFVVVLDNCDTEASWSVEETILIDSPNELTVEREYTASDACGNTATYVETATLILQVFGCTDATACNYDEFANEDDGSCFYPLYAYDCDGNCINDVNENGICDELEVAGCTDPDNPGYNPEANIDDGSCLTGGCTIAFACNYDPTAEFQIAGTCEFASCAGCTLEGACNYDEDATLNDGSCTFPDYGYDCNGECLNDTDGDGICDEFEIAGCTDPTNPAYNPAATDDDGSCLVAGCLLPFACNFDPTADYLDVALCDLSSCAGCTDPAACTYDPNATLSAPAACTYPVSQFVDCDGICNNDADGDGVCDELEIPGCTNPEASNYSPFATDDNGTCIIEVGGCTLPFACNFDPTADFYLPGSCDFSCLFGMPPGDGNCADELACNYGADEPCVYFDGEGNLCAVVGCTTESACNFNPDAQISGECEFDSCQVFGCTNANACNFNADANTENGTCDYTTCVGCTDSDASNFDPEATVDNGQCSFDVSGCTLLIACNFDPAATVNDGSCDFFGCYGCVTPSACNYDANALYPDGSCTFADNGQDCDGNCLFDSDGDSVCDSDEVSGCTDATALNFNPNATDDNGSCTYITGGCTDQTACNFDYTAQEDDGTCEFNTCAGCIVSWACNYNADATYNDGSCIFPDAGGACPSNCDFDADGDGICDANEIAGCIYGNAINFEPLATDDDGTCTFVGCVLPEYSSYNGLANTNSGDCTNTPRSADFNGDGTVQLGDLLDFLLAYGSSGPEWGIDWVQEGCEVAAMGIAEMDVDDSGCTYPTAANFDPSATFDTGSCVWLGCTDATAYNYNNLATLDDSSCQYSLCPDFNGDGQVQAIDLLDFLLAWGTVYE